MLVKLSFLNKGYNPKSRSYFLCKIFTVHLTPAEMSSRAFLHLNALDL